MFRLVFHTFFMIIGLIFFFYWLRNLEFKHYSSYQSKNLAFAFMFLTCHFCMRSCVSTTHEDSVGTFCQELPIFSGEKLKWVHWNVYLIIVPQSFPEMLKTRWISFKKYFRNCECFFFFLLALFKRLLLLLSKLCNKDV